MRNLSFVRFFCNFADKNIHDNEQINIATNV